MNERFEIPARLRTTSLVLILIGIVTLVIGVFALLNSHAADHETLEPHTDIHYYRHNEREHYVPTELLEPE